MSLDAYEADILTKFRHAIDSATPLVDGWNRTEIAQFAMSQYIQGQCDALEMDERLLDSAAVRADYVAMLRRVADALLDGETA